MNRDLFLSILAMDSYNRGYGAGLGGLAVGGGIGQATILTDAVSELDANEVLSAGFYAVAYEWNGETIISYRGTNPDSLVNLSADALNGWVVGGGAFAGDQAPLTVEFYHSC